jgi:hypothetical protein
MENMLTVGEFAEAIRISPKALRIYAGDTRLAERPPPPGFIDESLERPLEVRRALPESLRGTERSDEARGVSS